MATSNKPNEESDFESETESETYDTIRRDLFETLETLANDKKNPIHCDKCFSIDENELDGLDEAVLGHVKGIHDEFGCSAADHIADHLAATPVNQEELTETERKVAQMQLAFYRFVKDTTKKIRKLEQQMETLENKRKKTTARKNDHSFNALMK